MHRMSPLLFALIGLAGCVSLADTRTAENATEFTLAADYQKAYRIIDENFKLCQNAEGVSSAIYPDQQRANITFGMQQVTAFSLDLAATGEQTTAGTFYTTYKAQKEYIPIFKAWVEQGKTGCNMKQIEASQGQ